MSALSRQPATHRRSPTPSGAALVPAVDRAIQILSLIKEQPGDWSIAALHRTLGLPKSTIHAIVTTLAHHGYLERNGDRPHYRLGRALLELAHYVPDQPQLPDLARPYLQHLRDALDETVFLGVYIDSRATLLAAAESRQMIKISAPTGKRLPLDAGCFGKLYFATLDNAALERLLLDRPLRAYTAHTRTTLQELRDELAQVRAQGYATDDQEYLENVWAVAAPVHQHGRLEAAIAVVGIRSRMDEQKRARAIEGVLAAAHAVEQRRG